MLPLPFLTGPMAQEEPIWKDMATCPAFDHIEGDEEQAPLWVVRMVVRGAGPEEKYSSTVADKAGAIRKLLLNMHDPCYDLFRKDLLSWQPDDYGHGWRDLVPVTADAVAEWKGFSSSAGAIPPAQGGQTEGSGHCDLSIGSCPSVRTTTPHSRRRRWY
jgi:hypothetical protein